jgi:hypothetical protein
MSDSPTPEAPVPSAPASPDPDGADVPPGDTPQTSSPVVTAGRSVGLAVLAILVAFGLSLLIGPPIAGRICEGIDPNSGDPFGDILAAAILCAVAFFVVFMLLYVVLLVTLLLVMSTLGWAAWGRRTFFLTLAAGVGLTILAGVILALIGD